MEAAGPKYLLGGGVLGAKRPQTPYLKRVLGTPKGTGRSSSPFSVKSVEKWGLCMQELLLHMFEHLEQADIQYCLLRGYEELDQLEDSGDVDLLVHADQLERFRAILARLEFVTLPSWGHAPHQFSVAYDQGS